MGGGALNIVERGATAALGVGHSQVVMEPSPSLGGSLSARDGQSLFVCTNGFIDVVGPHAIDAAPVCGAEGLLRTTPIGCRLVLREHGQGCLSRLNRQLEIVCSPTFDAMPVGFGKADLNRAPMRWRGLLGCNHRGGVEGGDGPFYVLRPFTWNAVEIDLSQTIVNAGQIGATLDVVERLLIGGQGPFQGGGSVGALYATVLVGHLTPHPAKQIVPRWFAEGPRVGWNSKSQGLFDLLCSCLRRGPLR